jgi:hypothetical protein
MVLYTCVKNIDSDFYFCVKGFYEVKDEKISDLKVISVPNSSLTFPILQDIEEFEILKLSFSGKDRRKVKRIY